MRKISTNLKRGSHILKPSENESDGIKGQATKSARGMPWHWEPMKDVVNCDKLRGAVNRRYIRRFPNGATHIPLGYVTYGE